MALFSGSRTFILNLFLKAELEIMMLHEKMDVLAEPVPPVAQRSEGT